MLTILIALLGGAAVGAAFRLSNLVHSPVGAIFPAVAATLIIAVLLFRRIGNQIGPIVEEAQRHVMGNRRELALAKLRSGLALGRWHPLLAGQLRAQLGALLYDAGKADEAIAELTRASKRPWESRAFLGCAYFKQKADEPMRRAFEDAVKVGKKDGLSWTLYAWCQLARSKRAEAQAVLERALKELPGDQRISNNLELVKEGKKLKVAPYGDRWARFQIDGSVPGAGNVPKAMRGFAQRPGFRQRPQRKR